MTSQEINKIEETVMGEGQTTQVRENWAKALMEKGVIVSLHIGRWRAQAKLTPKDLGFDESDEELNSFFRRYFSLGNKLLITTEMKKKLDRIESRGRACLKRYSFDTVFGSFVPYTSFEFWKEENEKVKSEYLDCMHNFLDTFTEVIEEANEEYRKAAEQLWDRITALQTQEKETFVTGFIERLQSRVPTPELVEESFYYDCNYSTIPMPSFIEEDIRKAKIKSICTDANEETIQKISSMCDTVAEEYMTKKSEIIDKFLDNTVKHLRAQIASLCDEVIICIEKNKKLAKKKVTSIQKNLKRLETMNFFDDTEMSKNLKRVSKIVNGLDVEQEEDALEEIKDSFKEIAINSRKSMVGTLKGSVVRFANLEIP